MIFNKILTKVKAQKKVFAVLIDPDQFPDQNLLKIITAMEAAQPDIILVGGSLVANKTDEAVCLLKKHLSIPVVLFPGKPDSAFN